MFRAIICRTKNRAQVIVKRLYRTVIRIFFCCIVREIELVSKGLSMHVRNDTSLYGVVERRHVPAPDISKRGCDINLIRGNKGHDAYLLIPVIQSTKNPRTVSGSCQKRYKSVFL